MGEVAERPLAVGQVLKVLPGVALDRLGQFVAAAFDTQRLCV